MSSHTPPLNLTIRVGCHITYETSVVTPVILMLRPLPDEGHVVRQEICQYGPHPHPREFEDAHGNRNCRTLFLPGKNDIFMDAHVAVSYQPESFGFHRDPVPVDELPASVLRYTLPSRYCDSDKLLDFAWQHFGPNTVQGVHRVRAILDWVHDNIEYRFGSGRADMSASEVIARGYGVCRDFGHVVVALCRAFNIPARYVTGHLPDIGCLDPGSPMDFHAYAEVYLGHRWHTVDARFNVPRIGRIKLGHGLDAIDGAFSTIYGEAQLTSFYVWAYQVNPQEVPLGSPVDLTKRLDGTEAVRVR